MGEFGDNLGLDRCSGIFSIMPPGYIGPNALVGYPNRYMVVIYQVWILVVAGLTWRLDKQNKGEN